MEAEAWLFRSLSVAKGFAVQSLVGHFLQPLPRLAIDIGEVSELAEGPEVLTNIPDAPAFDFSFLPSVIPSSKGCNGELLNLDAFFANARLNGT